jgi:hypothetical protein
MLDIATNNAKQIMQQQLASAKEDPSVAQVIAQINHKLH